MSLVDCNDETSFFPSSSFAEEFPCKDLKTPTAARFSSERNSWSSTQFDAEDELFLPTQLYEEQWLSSQSSETNGDDQTVPDVDSRGWRSLGAAQNLLCSEVLESSGSSRGHLLSSSNANVQVSGDSQEDGGSEDGAVRHLNSCTQNDQVVPDIYIEE